MEQLEVDIVRYKEIEALLRETLISAERAASELKEQARREAELILTEAHAEARRVQREALVENERLLKESRRIKAQLATALELIETPGDAAEPEEENDGQGTWPGEREAA